MTTESSDFQEVEAVIGEVFSGEVPLETERRMQAHLAAFRKRLEARDAEDRAALAVPVPHKSWRRAAIAAAIVVAFLAGLAAAFHWAGGGESSKNQSFVHPGSARSAAAARTVAPDVATQTPHHEPEAPALPAASARPVALPPGVMGLGSADAPSSTTSGALRIIDFAVDVDSTTVVKSDGTVWHWPAWMRPDGAVWSSGAWMQPDGTEDRQLAGLGGHGHLDGIVAISSFHHHTLALESDGTVWAWGRNQFGQLGTGVIGGVEANPVQVSPGILKDIVAVSAGQFHSLAVKSDGTVWGWGRNHDVPGSLASPPGLRIQVEAAEILTPTQVPGLTDIVAVASGYNYSLALKSDGTVLAWGYNDLGQLGDGTKFNVRTAPVQVVGPGGSGTLTGVAAVAAAGGYSLALKSDGTVWAWGDNRLGQLGDRTKKDSPTPVQVSSLSGVVAVVAVVDGNPRGDSCLALKSDGTVWGWGRGPLVGGDDDFSVPVQVPGLTDILAVRAAPFRAMALKSDGTLWAWGYFGPHWGLDTPDGGKIEYSRTPVQFPALSGSGNRPR